MLDLPFSSELIPRALTLPSGALVEVPLWKTIFKRWTGDRLPTTFRKTYTIKYLLELDGERLFAEMAICRVLAKDGWNAVWLDTFHNKTWDRMIDSGSAYLLPREISEAYNPVVSDRGVWDVFAWNATGALFLESKGPGDSIKPNQLGWLERAMNSGLDLQFVIVEWAFDTSH